MVAQENDGGVTTGDRPQCWMKIGANRPAGDEIEFSVFIQKFPALIGVEPTILATDIVGVSLEIVLLSRFCETVSCTVRVVRVHPTAIHVGKLDEPVGVGADTLSAVVVIIRIVLYSSTDEHGFIDAAPVHFEQQLLHPSATLEVGNGRFVGPLGPGMAVRIDDHFASLLWFLHTLLVGENPLNREKLWHWMDQMSTFGRGFTEAELGVVDCAL